MRKLEFEMKLEQQNLKYNLSNRVYDAKENDQNLNTEQRRKETELELGRDYCEESRKL